ncbi:hypothetical protein CEN40_00680 [Fischerella thermalis CCMEE 5205]|nr:hypothetical protein CEN40_00680 [Fischerella thermalis CCMEE 5205]
MPEIETARLRLRPYTLDDLDETAVILSNPEVMKYSPRGTIPQDKVLNLLVRAGFKPAPSALCLSSVMEKAGLKYEKDAHFYNLDVVYYALTRAAWQPDESSYTPLL